MADIYAEAREAARAALAKIGELHSLSGDRSTVPLVGFPWIDLLTLWSEDTSDPERVEAAQRLAHGQLSLASLFHPLRRPQIRAALKQWSDGRDTRQAWEELVVGPILLSAEGVRQQSWPYWLGINSALGAWRLAPDDARLSLGEALATIRREVRRDVERELLGEPAAVMAELPTRDIEWDLAARLEAAEAWVSVMSILSPGERAVLEAALDIGEPDWAAIAERLGRAESTVRVEVLRARRKYQQLSRTM